MTTELSLNYFDLRKSLEPPPASPRHKSTFRPRPPKKARPMSLAEQKKHEEERGILITKVGELQAANDKQATEIANLNTKNKQQEEDFTAPARDATPPSSESSATSSRGKSLSSIDPTAT